MAWWDDGPAALPGYPYSTALAQAGITWDADSLDKWLAAREHFIPGAEMPFSLPDAVRRRDVIAYLETLKPANTTRQAAVPASATGQAAVPRQVQSGRQPSRRVRPGRPPSR